MVGLQVGQLEYFDLRAHSCGSTASTVEFVISGRLAGHEILIFSESKSK